jgi:hypothetical protein
MDCNELLRRQLANRLLCQSQQIAVGPTGGTGPVGPAGTPAPVIGLAKAYTILVDYSTQASISRVVIPPGLFTNPVLIGGGTFTSNVGTDLLFLGLDSITCSNMSNRFVVGMQVSGYLSSNQWIPIPGGNIGPTKTYYSVSTDGSVQIRGLNLTNINGANASTRPAVGVAAGFLVTITLFYY